MKVKVIVSSGQYETSATTVTINCNTARGLARRATQLSDKYATYGDNWAGWIKAEVTLKSAKDEWGDNQIIGGQWCDQKGLDLLTATYDQIRSAVPGLR